MNKNTQLLLAGLTILTATLGYTPFKEYYTQSDPFYLQKLPLTVTDPLSLYPPDLSAIRKTLPNSVINQSYRYLYEGSSAIVFISADNQYIFKILKQNASSIPTLILPPGQHRYGVNHKEIDTTSLQPHGLRYNSYLLAIDRLQKETGLIFLHLDRLQDLDTQLLVLDKKGQQRILSLDDYAFVFQKKGDPIYQTITKLMRNNQIDKAKALVGHTLQSVFTLCREVVIDESSVIKKHMSCIGEQCLFMDVEHFQRQKEMIDGIAYLQQVDDIIDSFEIWLKQKHPKLAIEAKNQITQLKQEHLAGSSTTYERLLQ
jgi:hypothetical protein